MAGPWITLDEHKQEIADILKKDVGTLESYWTRLAANTRDDGYKDLLGILLGKGYTIAQLDAWDDRTRYNRDQALFWAYTKGAGLSAYEDKNIDKLDHRKELIAAATITINGVAVVPGAEDVDAGASVGGGTISEEGYRITTETEF